MDGDHPDPSSEDQEPLFEPSWPHLQIVYEFFLRFIVSSEVNAKVAKKFADQPFCFQVSSTTPPTTRICPLFVLSLHPPTCVRCPPQYLSLSTPRPPTTITPPPTPHRSPL
jgi:hypothetical protein